MTKLEELWLNGNPLKSLPPEIEQCRALRIVDLRDTLVETLPREMSRLKNILEVDLRNCVLDTKLQAAYGPACNTPALMAALKAIDTEVELRLKLERRLRDTVRVEVSAHKYRVVGRLTA